MPSNQERGIDIPKDGRPEVGPTGTNHLLVIAIDAYDYCPVLNNCVKDAQDFAQLLWDRYQFEERLTTFLFNKDATRSNILEKLSELEEKVQVQDSLLIYYSGHGETKENAGYWIPVNGRGEHRYRHEWVSTDDLIRHLDAIDSFHTVVIADACFSGSLFAPLQKNTSPGNERYKSRLGLAASHSRGKALDGTAGENSPFAERLLQNLKGNKSELGFWKLATTVQEEVSKVTEGKQTPVFKPLNVKGDDSGQFVFKLRIEEEERIWAQALEGKDIVSFHAYLDQFPGGSHAATAREIIRELEEEGHWEQARSSDSIGTLLDFLDKYPNSRFRKGARERIDYLEDIQDWEKACRGGKITDFLEYKDNHANGRYLQEADERIFSLRELRREADAWRKAQNEHSELGYQRYLEDFPTGPNVQKANAELESIARKERIGADRARDEAAWSKARGEDTVPAYQQYLDGFPEGMYRKAAAEKMEALERAAVLEGAAARDRQAWDLAVQEHTITAYRGYLGSGHLLFKKEAEQAIAGLQESSARQKDAAAWNEAVRKNTREGYLEYIRAGHTLHKEEAEKLAARIPAAHGKDGGGSGEVNNSLGREKELKQLGFAVAAVFLVIALIWRPWENNSPKGNLQQAEKYEVTENVGAPQSLASPAMVTVPGGTFQMGDVMGDKEETDETVHGVTLGAFQIGAYEVTFEEYDAFCTATKREKPSDSGWGRGKRPVINVSWEDVVAYCNWRSRQEGLREVYTISGSSVSANWQANGYRLPTEAEWEYAARAGGKKVRFGNGKDIADPKEINFDGSADYKKPYSVAGEYRSKTLPVGSFSPNALGLYDMSGNVWEWCWDWYDSYSTSAQTNPKGPNTGSGRVIRGGSWDDVPQNCRVARRSGNTPGYRDFLTGFRLSRTL